MSRRTLRLIDYVELALLVVFAVLFATLVVNAGESRLIVRASIQQESTPGRGVDAFWLSVPGGRFTVMGDNDIALIQWLRAHDGEQVVIELREIGRLER